jgi:ArsR family transcriptional regulator, arsenate/arsenite/antimonite-responsive transcriptional repressor
MPTLTARPPAPPLPVVRALADPMRWAIVELLADEQLCVCHLVEELGVPQPLVSHHLKVLRDACLVVGERWRYWTYYRLAPGALRAVVEHLEGIETRVGSSVPPTRRPCC